MDVLTFNGVSLRDFETYYDGSQLFSVPERDVEFFSVPGKNGDLSIDNGRYNNVEIEIPCFIRKDFRRNFSNLINFLYSQEGYKRLETTKEPDIYRMASITSHLEPDTGSFLQSGAFTLTFNCKPQKWLKSGENAIYIDNSISLINRTSQIAKPLIEVIGTGSITINSSILTLSQNTSKTYIDCEIQDCYEGTINRNGDLSIVGGFPVLNPGENTITVSGCTINLIPRWWIL